jgi:signal transduction histidine kinase
MKLVPKLSLAFVAGMLIVLAGNGYFRVQRDVALFDSDRARDDVLIGETLAAAVETVWKSDGPERARAVVDQTNARGPRVQVRWVWLDGTEPLAMSREEARALTSGAPLTRLDEDGERRFTFVRVMVPDPRPGALEVSESLAPEHAYVRQTILSTVVTALVMGAFCVLLAYALGAWIVGRPMRALAAKARRVGQGDFGEPLHLTQHDEMATLAGEMNAMCDRLEEAELRAARDMRARLEMIEQLRHADRLMTVGKLASGVAHEIGTPLNVVEARASMIADGSASAAEAVDYAKVIVRATERIARIIRQLLAFARRETAEKSPCDLTVLARHTTEMLAPLASKRRVDLRVEDGGTACFALADAPQIEQALTNLVMNALHATDDATASTDAKAVDILLDYARALPPADVGGDEAEYARVRVRDEGRGIEPEHLAHVFEPFFTTKDVGEGTGLGLSITYGIVREHGGWIEVASQPGKGTELSFFLPRPSP